MNITNPYGPNTTILLPGGCNAMCSFCFWNRNESKIVPPADYFDKVFNILNKLPEDFKTLSISGGEPTISAYFSNFIDRLAKFRRENSYLDRVVLTTHGGNLDKHIPFIHSVVNHVNISRHAIGDKLNQEAFNSNKIPTDAQLKDLIRKIHKETSCDVTLNCVIDPEVSTEFCYEFIEYAKNLGANAVSFRKVASDALPTDAEQYFVGRYGKIKESKCPVCRGLTQNVKGFNVRWKGSVNEPSITTGGVYEAVIHPDGNVYTDWNMKVPLDLSKVKTKPKTKVKPVSIPKVSKSSSGGGCGSGGCGR